MRQGHGGGQHHAPPQGASLVGGRYRLDEQAGASGPVETFHATDTRLNRPIMVTLFPQLGQANADRWFLEEAQRLANLNHPGLATVHDFGVDRGEPFLVTEQPEGPTLRQALQRQELSPRSVARMGAEVANVLSYLHDSGIVHGHLRPANLVRDPSGIVRLTGAGVATLLQACGYDPGQGADDPATDILALGRTLRMALTGDPRGPLPDLDPALRRALTAMTTADPQRRPNARQAESMLAASRPPRPAADVPDYDDDGDDDRGSRPPTTRLVVAVGIIVLLAVVVGAWLMSGKDDGDTATAEEPTSTSQEGDDSGPSLPTGLPDFEAPDLPDVPTDLPDAPEIPDDAQGVWDSFVDWVKSNF